MPSTPSIQEALTRTNTEFNQAMKKTAAGTKDMGKEQFLQLLVTQLKNQDPLNPMEDQEFIAQMAQFSSLEQLVNLNTSMEGLTEATNNQQMFSATSYIGKYVTAVGNTIGKTSTLDADGKVSETSITPMYYRFTGPTAHGTITVYDANGSPVYVENLEAMNANTTYRFQWDGRNNRGETLPDATYTVALVGYNADEETVLCTPLVADKVTDVLRDGSSIYLRLHGGQQMLLSDVELVSVEKPVITAEEAAGSKGQVSADGDGEKKDETAEAAPEAGGSDADAGQDAAADAGQADAADNGSADAGQTADSGTAPDAGGATS